MRAGSEQQDALVRVLQVQLLGRSVDAIVMVVVKLSLPKTCHVDLPEGGKKCTTADLASFRKKEEY